MPVLTSRQEGHPPKAKWQIFRQELSLSRITSRQRRLLRARARSDCDAVIQSGSTNISQSRQGMKLQLQGLPLLQRAPTDGLDWQPESGFLLSLQSSCILLGF